MDSIFDTIPTVGRRSILKGGAAAGLGLIIGFHWSTKEAEGAAAPVAPGAFAPNAFVRVAPDSTVTVISKHTEYGQGVFTGLPTILAEELDADWAQVRVEAAPSDAKLYSNLVLKGSQTTGGSLSIVNSWDQLRNAGATARAMLVAAAAAQWRVPAGEITVEKGVIEHKKSGKSGHFGDFVAAAAKLPVPANVPLKDPKDYKLIGTYIPRYDTAAKTDGSALYTIDMTSPGMLIAMVQHSPRFGSKVKSFDAAVARAIPGVVDVVPLDAGVAVLAKNFWAAKKGRDAVQIVWDDSKAEMRSTADIFAEYRKLAATEQGKLARNDGDTGKALAGAAKRLSAVFEFPYLAHAPMEPLDCVIRMTKDSCEMWSGTQSPSRDQDKAVAITGLPLEQVKVNVLYAGGAFGRRGTRDGDPSEEAIRIAHARGGDGIPIKVIWTREDDIRGGMYRPMVHHALEAGLDANGKLIAWKHHLVGQGALTSGASDLPYVIPNMEVHAHSTVNPVTTAPLRSVDHTHTAFATEVFMDEVAAAAGRDPVEFRRELLAGKDRYLAVLNTAAEKGGWGEKMPPGKGRGIAVHFAMGSWVAQVVDVTAEPNGGIKVDRVVCAVDCGIAVNPDIVRAQMEGGIGFGLGLALHGAITLKDGRVEQSNFDNYRVLRMAEMPKVEVHIVPSLVTPSGVGEPGVPPIGPGVSNAYFAATGKRLRMLPLDSNTNSA